jgi:hypothetical protein
MPVFRVGSELHYFAHVPKCGGSSVELYLQRRFGTLAFVDYAPMDRAAKQRRWTRTSPQHVAWSEFARLMPADWIAGAFGVVRHPEARLVSAYHRITDTISDEAERPPLDIWFQAWIDREDPHLFDNHLLPQSELVPDWATVFRLEDGLDSVIPYLDMLAGNETGPRVLPAINRRAAGATRPRATISGRLADQVAEIYAQDYARFGYRPGGGVNPAPSPVPRPAPRREGAVWRVLRRARYALKSRGG